MEKRKAAGPAPRIEVSPEQRQHLIDDVAYFRSIRLRQQEPASDNDTRARDEAEAEIDAVMKEHHVAASE